MCFAPGGPYVGHQVNIPRPTLPSPFFCFVISLCPETVADEPILDRKSYARNLTHAINLRTSSPTTESAIETLLRTVN